MAGIEVQNLTKTFRGGMVKALDGVSLAVAPGEVCGVIGPNGAGKTTLMGCLLGLLSPTSGDLRIDGLSPDDMAVRTVTGYLPERLTLDRWMTGRDFLEYHHGLARLPAIERRGAAASALDQVGLANGAGDKSIRTYSRGMLQRLGLAQALIGRPRYVYLDEPTSGMDPSGVVLFRKLIRDEAARGATILLNSHQLEQVERLCDRVVFVRGGRVESIATVDAGATMVRVLRIRLARSAEALQTEPLPLTPVDGVQLVNQDGAEIQFAVADDAAAARLLRYLVERNYPVIEAVPDEGRLERLFTGHEPGAPA